MSKTIEDNLKSRIYKWISKLLFATFFILIILNLPTVCQSHSHGHSHNNEPPSFKYSKEAQNMYVQNEHIENNNNQKVHQKQAYDHSHMQHEESALPEKSYNDIILRAVGSTLFISAAPFLILFLLPIDNSKESEPHLKILLSFASGGLLGDAFLHLIPHALIPHESDDKASSHSHSHSHQHGDNEHGGHSHSMSVGICVLLGIVVFLVVEKIVRIIKTDHSHMHSHSVAEKLTENKSDKSSSKAKKKDSNQSEVTTVGTHQNEIKISGYMNLAADFLHNFTDGLAISASYLVSNNIGYVTTFTIFCHEIPHEIGDFAILIQSGYSARKAMLLQLTTALGALLGTYVSFVAEGMGDFATMWILPFTAGGFIYIATVSIIPDLLTDTKFWQSVKEIVALVVGVGMMVLIATYE